MTNQQILERAVQKAIDGGWSDYKGLEAIELVKASSNTVTLKGWVEFVDEGYSDEAQTEIDFNFMELIFNHDFAKALWGDDGKHYVNSGPTGDVIPDDDYHLRAWQYHLQQMVIAGNPIKYLGEHLDE